MLHFRGGVVGTCYGIDYTTCPTVYNPYIQLSDSTNQEPGTTTATLVTFNTLDEQAGFTFAPTSGSITVPASGVYCIIVGGQVGKTSGGTVKLFDMWLRKNDVDIPNSGVRNAVASASDTKVVIQNTGIALVAGDVVKVYMSVDDAAVGLGLKVYNPAGEPRIPSILFTMFKIGR